jgi:hypothetical protein
LLQFVALFVALFFNVYSGCRATATKKRYFSTKKFQKNIFKKIKIIKNKKNRI